MPCVVHQGTNPKLELRPGDDDRIRATCYSQGCSYAEIARVIEEQTTEGESQGPVNRHPPTPLLPRRPAVHPGAPLPLRTPAGFIRPPACPLPDGFLPGRDPVINASSQVIHGGCQRWGW